MNRNEKRVLTAWTMIGTAMVLWLAFGNALPWLQGLLMGYGICLVWTMPR